MGAVRERQGLETLVAPLEAAPNVETNETIETPAETEAPKRRRWVDSCSGGYYEDY